MQATRSASIVLLSFVLTGCTVEVPGEAGPKQQAPVAATASTASTASADQKVCVDLDARGEPLYREFVVPMMTGATGQKSVDVDARRFASATAAVQVVGEGVREQASAEISLESARLVAAAKALALQEGADGTALLTAFVTLSGACQLAGLKPSWFDVNALGS